jgi:hypothetical protein
MLGSIKAIAGTGEESEGASLFSLRGSTDGDTSVGTLAFFLEGSNNGEVAKLGEGDKSEGVSSFSWEGSVVGLLVAAGAGAGAESEGPTEDSTSCTMPSSLVPCFEAFWFF